MANEPRDAIKLHPADNVAVALRQIKKGQYIDVGGNLGNYKTEILQDIACGHKFALGHIERGQLVRKYGEVIGEATDEIECGEHVHCHNLAGLRG